MKAGQPSLDDPDKLKLSVKISWTEREKTSLVHLSEQNQGNCYPNIAISLYKFIDYWLSVIGTDLTANKKFKCVSTCFPLVQK